MRFIWDKEFILVSCIDCGKYFATKEELAYVSGKDSSSDPSTRCEDCRRIDLSRQMHQMVVENIKIQSSGQNA